MICATAYVSRNVGFGCHDAKPEVLQLHHYYALGHPYSELKQVSFNPFLFNVNLDVSAVAVEGKNAKKRESSLMVQYVEPELGDKWGVALWQHVNHVFYGVSRV